MRAFERTVPPFNARRNILEFASMNKWDIERSVRALHGDIWRQQHKLWPGRSELSVVEIVAPEIAARVLGVDFQLHPELRWFSRPNAPLTETAGILDREGRTILISTRFPIETQRFTAAHEIGHFVLHNDVKETILHRDLPIPGLSSESTSRAWYEREADYFAACHLMPRKSVLAAFEARFSTAVPFVFNEAAAFELCPDDPDSLMRPFPGSSARAVALASARYFRRRHLVPLYQQFRVSVSSMSIRLEELGLIHD